MLILFLFCHKNLCCGTHQKCLIDMFLMSTHNICFCGEIRQILYGYSFLSGAMTMRNFLSFYAATQKLSYLITTLSSHPAMWIPTQLSSHKHKSVICWHLNIHTCHTSHCETKSHRILALLDPVSHKIFKSHRIFIPFNKLFFEELEINHSLAWLSQA